MRGVAIALLGTAGLLAAGGATAQQRTPREPSRGIRRLSLQAHAEAIACGRQGADCAITPYQLCPDAQHRFVARLATPFSRVAYGVAEAVRNGNRVRPMTPGAANGWGVGIYVLPDDSEEGDAIQRVFLRRGPRTVQPTTSTVAPWILKRADGATRQLSRGFFAFPMDAFTSERPTTIVFVGSSGESTCTLDTQRLARLR